MLAKYLPRQLSDEEIGKIVSQALSDGQFEGPGAMGQAMKAVQVVIAGRADGGKVAAEVRKQLSI